MEKFKADAERTVRLSYVLSSLAEKEKLSVTDEDIAREKERMLSENKWREAIVERYLTEKKDQVVSRIKEQKLFAFLLENAKVSEGTAGKSEKQSTRKKK
jgi:FKBP-type peptidyl-prolyl cis-trans isomerase (trigger factor)